MTWDLELINNMIKTIYNCNLLDIKVDIIIQSNNCFITQGTGIALAIRNKYPEVYKADQATVRGDRDKLGTILPVKLEANSQPYYCFLNYNQYNYGRNKRMVNYEAFYNCLELSRDKCIKLGYKSIGLPYFMSCKNASGDWNVISAMINSVFNNSDIDIFICKL